MVNQILKGYRKFIRTPQHLKTHPNTRTPPRSSKRRSHAFVLRA